MANILDYLGLERFLDKIKALFVTDVGVNGNSLTYTKDGVTSDITVPYATKTSSIPFGVTDDSSTSLAYTATVNGITELRDGVCCIIRNTKVDGGTSGITIDINGLGAKLLYRSNALSSTEHYSFPKNNTYLLVFSESLDGWIVGRLTDENDKSEAYNILPYTAHLKTKTRLGRYMICLTYNEEYVLPVNDTDNNSTTNKTLTTESFDPFGEVFFGYISYATLADNPAKGLYIARSLCNLMYSFNITDSTFTINKSVYLVMSPLSDGKCKLHSNPLSQTLPTTEDGLVYKLLGVAISGYLIRFYLHKPCYYFKDGQIREWTNNSDKQDLLVSGTNIKTVNNTSLLGSGNISIPKGDPGEDGEDAYQPFKGWFDSSSALSSAYPSPQVGDYAYVKGATSTDPVAIYACSVAGTWADSGNTFNPANNQEFASGEGLNTVHIVDGLESSSATDVLSAKQGKVLDQKVAALGPKVDKAVLNYPSTNESDLDITDDKGNVLAEFKDGHFKTKEFDSRTNGAISNLNTTDADLTITDEQSNAIVQFKEGHVITKNFDSRNIKASSGQGKDLSDEKDLIELPMPISIASVNIICPSLPTSPNKDDNYSAVLEYYDGVGNYFKKNIVEFNRQGRSSMNAPKSNYSFDIADGTKIRFGKWVPQDSFHLKANYIDAFRGGRNIVSYRVQTEINDFNKWEDARPWRKLTKGNTTIYDSNGDLDCNALGVPDGFPVKMYFNGEFFGLYVWSLKKHRDNMCMDKSKSKNIQLDGDGWATFFQGETHIDWTRFEVRNPKYLVYATSDTESAKDREYDADISQREIAGETSSVHATEWDSSTTYAKNAIVTNGGRMYLSLKGSNAGNAPVACTKVKNIFSNATEYWIDITECNKVKQYIRNLANAYNSISSTSDFEQYFDSAWCIDYVLQVNAFMNADVFCNNTQWCTWDGVKWWPMAYDQDQCFGLHWSGSYIRGTETADANQSVDSCMLGITVQTGTPLSKLFTLFKSDMDARYKELVDADILSTHHIVSRLSDWVASIGKANYEEEFEKWSETPSYRDNGTYTDWPTSGGFHDSIGRVEVYLEARENYLKNYFNYQ